MVAEAYLIAYIWVARVDSMIGERETRKLYMFHNNNKLLLNGKVLVNLRTNYDYLLLQ